MDHNDSDHRGMAQPQCADVYRALTRFTLGLSDMLRAARWRMEERVARGDPLSEAERREALEILRALGEHADRGLEQNPKFLMWLNALWEEGERPERAAEMKAAIRELAAFPPEVILPVTLPAARDGAAGGAGEPPRRTPAENGPPWWLSMGGALLAGAVLGKLLSPRP